MLGIQRGHCSEKEFSSTGDGGLLVMSRLFYRQEVLLSGSLEGLSARSVPVSVPLYLYPGARREEEAI